MRLVVGADVVAAMVRWAIAGRVRARAPPLVLVRAGVPKIDSPLVAPNAPAVLPEVSSTAVRAAFAREDQVDPLVPKRVLAYARARGLYR
jgi:nicotinic acid mononucleotide adenylyltransferase